MESRLARCLDVRTAAHSDVFSAWGAPAPASARYARKPQPKEVCESLQGIQPEMNENSDGAMKMGILKRYDDDGAVSLLEPATDNAEKTLPLYSVILHNDEITTDVYVRNNLELYFRKSADDAIGIMMIAHFSGLAIVGGYPLERAEFMIERAHADARSKGYPLTYTIEER